jgi:hypothetical protein
VLHLQNMIHLDGGVLEALSIPISHKCPKHIISVIHCCWFPRYQWRSYLNTLHLWFNEMFSVIVGPNYRIFQSYVLESSYKNLQNVIIVLCCIMLPKCTSERFPVVFNVTCFPFRICVSVTLHCFIIAEVLFSDNCPQNVNCHILNLVTFV